MNSPAVFPHEPEPSPAGGADLDNGSAGGSDLDDGPAATPAAAADKRPYQPQPAGSNWFSRVPEDRQPRAQRQPEEPLFMSWRDVVVACAGTALGVALAYAGTVAALRMKHLLAEMFCM